MFDFHLPVKARIQWTKCQRIDALSNNHLVKQAVLQKRLFNTNAQGFGHAASDLDANIILAAVRREVHDDCYVAFKGA